MRQIDRRRHRLFGEREGIGKNFGILYIAEAQLMQVGRIFRFIEGDVAARTPHLAVIGYANLFNRLPGAVFEKDAPQHLADRSRGQCAQCAIGVADLTAAAVPSCD